MPIHLTKNLNPKKHIHIIGGGISALALGYYFKQYQLEFTIHEKTNRVGGKIQTLSTEYGKVENAANAIFVNENILDVLEDLNLKYLTAQSGLKRKIWRKDKVQSPPISKLEILKIVFRAFKKIPEMDLKTVSVFDFFKPWLGEQICEEVLGPALVGIYSHDIKDLHFESLFKNVNTSTRYIHFISSLIKARKGKTKGVSVSFENGMQGFIDALSKRLKSHIQTNEDVQRLNFDNYLIATDANVAAELLRGEHTDIAKELEKIDYTQICTKTLFTKKEIPFLKKSFGILFAFKSPFKTLGILANHCIFPHMTKDSSIYSYTFIMKGSESSDDEMCKDIKKLTNESFIENRLSVQETQWKRAIPVYNQQRFRSIENISQIIDKKEVSISLFGNYIDGVSLRDIFTNAKDFAKELSS